jgi:hypothetical protein
MRESSPGDLTRTDFDLGKSREVSSGGEEGIRTLDTTFAVWCFSKALPSATRPPLRCRSYASNRPAGSNWNAFAARGTARSTSDARLKPYLLIRFKQSYRTAVEPLEGFPRLAGSNTAARVPGTIVAEADLTMHERSRHDIIARSEIIRGTRCGDCGGTDRARPRHRRFRLFPTRGVRGQPNRRSERGGASKCR